jgi:hypothetical protein
MPEAEARLAWFRNYYECASGGGEWTDEWSCTCDDDCPECGARHMSPYRSEDLSEIIDEVDGKFVALKSADSAEHAPSYKEIAVLCEVPEPPARRRRR